MEKIGIITDSACDLRKDQLDPELVQVLPLKILFSDGEYKDGVTISAEETYRRMDQEIPKTSLPDGKDMERALDYFRQRGVTHILGIFLSSGLSGTFNAFRHFAQEYAKDLSVYCIDSLSLSLGEGLLVLEAQQKIKQGHTTEEVIQAVHEKIKRIDVYFVLDTLEYLIKGGRIGKVSGTIGQLLNIKPIIHINEEGVYHSVEKARGKKQALSKLLALLKNKHLAKGDCNVYPMHGGNPEEGRDVLAQIRALPGVQDSYTDQITPSLGVHTGKGLLGLIVERI
ncbi:hypothetical protein ABB02_00047 [Clostridiaceae bacterium JG1575]|nr:hypothetical protein ABB02_00047 [Clostridiaceae bacterium JG1575]